MISVLYLILNKNRLNLDSALQKIIKVGIAHTLIIASFVDANRIWSGSQKGKEKMSCREEAEKVKKELIEQGICEVAELAGSLRRGEESLHDADIVCGSATMPLEQSRQISFSREKCPKIEVYVANPKHFGAMLLTYTGPAGSNIGMRKIAKEKGMLLNQYGLYNKETGGLLASETEDEICEKVLERKCKSPEMRGK